MELYQLRTFLTVAAEEHLTRAAEKLFTSQPAVSAHIRALEEELGVKLFDRTAKGMTPTAAGLALQEEARRIVEAARQFKQQAETLRTTVSGVITLGLNNQPDFLRLVAILKRLTATHPELRYEMITTSSGGVLQGIDDGTIGIGFFEGACTNPRIACDVIGVNDLCLLAPAAWEPSLRTCDWKALQERPWIFASPMCSYYRIIEHICREQGLRIEPQFLSDDCLAALQLASEGLGLTIFSRAQLALSPAREKLYVVPHFQASLPLCLGYLSTRAEDPVIRAVRDAICAVWVDPAPPEPATRSEVRLSIEPAEVPRPRGRRDRVIRGKGSRL